MQLNIKRIEAIIFDVDGTLCDTDDEWVKQLEKSLKPLRFFFPNNSIKPFARWLVMSIETPGNFIYHMLDRFHVDDMLANIFNRISKKDLGHRPRIPLIIPNVFSMLNTLKDYYPLAIVSAGGKSRTMAFLKYFKLDPFFKVIVTSQTCKYTKPFPDPVLWAAEQMGVKPDRCLMVGDTVTDIRAGKTAGAQTVGVLCGFGREKELSRAGADLILRTTSDLSNLLIEKLE